MQSIRQIEKLNAAELASVVPPSASWHTDYRDSAYVYIGGLPFALSEGDVLAVFSQFGNPVHIHLVRDQETGKSRGFCFLKYEDQRSCDLAVDNLSGAVVLGRTLSVDHARYELKEGEVEGAGLESEDEEDQGDGNADQSGSEQEERPMLREEAELAKLLREHDENDPMKAYLVKEKKEEVRLALQGLSMKGHHSDGRHHRRSRKDKEGTRENRAQRHKSRRDREAGAADGDRRMERHKTRPDDRGWDSKEDRYHSSRLGRHEEDGRSSRKSRRDLSGSPVVDKDADSYPRRKRDELKDDEGEESSSRRWNKSRTRSRSPYRRR
nr:u2 snrnp component ist3 [Quercus suber]